MVVDTHCHLDNNNMSISKINKMKDNIIIISGVDSKSNIEVLDIISKYDNVYGTLGIHPENVNEYNNNDIDFIEKNINNKKIVGIGEIGLDYHYSIESKEKQKELFIKQLSLAHKFNKTVVIHSRDAIKDTYEILKNYKELKKILHCYSGSLESAKEFIKINTFFGVGGIITFKNAKTLVEIVKELDLKNFVLETDSPYLAPEPYRGSENEPINVKLVAKKIAEIKNLKVEEVEALTTANALYLFDLQ